MSAPPYRRAGPGQPWFGCLAGCRNSPPTKYEGDGALIETSHQIHSNAERLRRLIRSTPMLPRKLKLSFVHARIARKRRCHSTSYVHGQTRSHKKSRRRGRRNWHSDGKLQASGSARLSPLHGSTLASSSSRENN